MPQIGVVAAGRLGAFHISCSLVGLFPILAVLQEGIASHLWESRRAWSSVQVL